MQFDPDNLSGQNNGRLPAEASSLPEGAKAFIRQYMPEDDDKGRVASFEWVEEFKPFKSAQESERTGKAVEIFERVLFVSIVVPGNDKLHVHRPATKNDERTFPFAWQQFNAGQSNSQRGTPLSKIGIEGPIGRALSVKNVFTIEELADVSDNLLQGMGLGSRELRARAREWVANNKAAHDGGARIDALQETVTAQSNQLAQALAAIERLSEENRKLAEKRGPGRPPKEVTK